MMIPSRGSLPDPKGLAPSRGGSATVRVFTPGCVICVECVALTLDACGVKDPDTTHPNGHEERLPECPRLPRTRH